MEFSMPLKKIDIGADIGEGWRLFQANMGTLVLAGVIATVISAVTCGILSGALGAGMFLVIRRLLKNDPVKPQAGDVFKGLDVFVQSLLLIVLATVASLILCFIPVIGQVASLAVGAVLMWALMFVAYQKLTAVDALKKVFEYTKSGEFTLPLLFAVIASLIAGLGVVACGVGVFFTIPLAYCMLASCYETLFGGEPEVIVPVSAETPPPPPPPPPSADPQV
jgi:hypothetical protein